MPRDEVEAAYFTLLRARDELAALGRYEAWLRDEARRLRRTGAEAAALAGLVDPRLRRPFRASDEALTDAVDRRLALLEDELGRLPERLAAASAFVDECEATHRALRAGGG